MVVYHQAFDLYHSVYRLLRLLTHVKRGQFVEVDRLRIWDFYLLFPDKMHSIISSREEVDVKALIRTYMSKQENPYETVFDSRKIFEKIRPYQITAIKCLASYGIISKEMLKEDKVSVVSKDLMKDYLSKFEPLSPKEHNAIALLTSHYFLMSMFGPNGLKAKTQLLESKYDA